MATVSMRERERERERERKRERARERQQECLIERERARARARDLRKLSSEGSENPRHFGERLGVCHIRLYYGSITAP